nr:DUF6240 domain-containing protein [Butyrivibrio sp.]
PMEELIERLKALLGQEGTENEASVADLSRAKVTGVNSSAIFSMSMRSISLISSGPCDVVGSVSSRFESISLSEIAVTSAEMTRRFKAAGEGYETMMTAPRADLGDSIKKAFRNVDDILADMGEELTDENRRTLRILGYNSIEITKSSIEQVRACDQKMQATIERLKPGAVLDLIREGRNPLSMTIQELSYSLDQGETSDERKEKKDEKYSRFLYKLEKKGEITEKEKASFIGIYRLFHNLKRTDYRAIGALLKSGQDMTLGNLLTAMRTQQAKRRGMDYTVDDEFGGLTAAGERTSARIDEQISAAFTYYRAKAEVVYENLEPEKLKEAAPTNQTLLPELADDLRSAAEDEALDREYARQQAQDMRNTASLRAADPALKELTAADIEVTFNNLEAMISNLRDRRDGKIWRDTEDRIGADTAKKQDELVDLLEEEDYEEKYVKILEDFSDKLTEELMGAQDTYVDVRAISLMHRQLSVMTQMARQQSYEIPVNIEGEKISMHVTLKRDESGSSRMDAGIQTIEYGFVAVSLYVKDGSIKGMLTTGNSQSPQQTEYLEDVRTRLCERLAEKIQDAGIGRENIAILYHAQTSPAVAGAFNTNATEGADTKLETQTLLKMAKAFIEAL